MFSIEHETLLLIVTSTFGNGEPPANGVVRSFKKIIKFILERNLSYFAKPVSFCRTLLNTYFKCYTMNQKMQETRQQTSIQGNSIPSCQTNNEIIIAIMLMVDILAKSIKNMFTTVKRNNKKYFCF